MTWTRMSRAASKVPDSRHTLTVGSHPASDSRYRESECRLSASSSLTVGGTWTRTPGPGVPACHHRDGVRHRALPVPARAAAPPAEARPHCQETQPTLAACLGLMGPGLGPAAAPGGPGIGGTGVQVY
jgi:hypothetical protein